MPYKSSPKKQPIDATGSINYNNVRDDHLIFISGICSIIVAAIVLLNVALANIYLSLLIVLSALLVIVLGTLCVKYVHFFKHAMSAMLVMAFSVVLFAFVHHHLV